MQFLLLTIYTHHPVTLYLFHCISFPPVTPRFFYILLSFFSDIHFSLYHRLPLLPRAFIFLLCRILSAQLSVFYYLFFLLDSLSDTPCIHYFLSVSFFILHTS